MANNATASDQEDECHMAMEAAIGVAMDHCASEEQLKASIARLLGIDPDVDTDRTLQEGLDESACEDFEAVRTWVLGTTLDRLNSEDMSISEALEIAWVDAQADCSHVGVPI